MTARPVTGLVRRTALPLAGVLAVVPVLVLSLVLGGCAGTSIAHRETSRPGATEIGSKPVTVPGRLVGNLLVVETRWDGHGPYHFLVDTGSSATLVSPEIAGRFGEAAAAGQDQDGVRVQSADDGSAVLLTATLRRLQLGAARFDHVPALVYDCSDLSAQMGIRIDGILGFTLFQETVFTLDYPNARLVLQTPDPALAGLAPGPGVFVGFTRPDKAPVIPVLLGTSSVDLLLDSGDDGALSLNPAACHPHFAYGPVDGPTVGTLAGDRVMQVGRLSDDLRVGGVLVPGPVASTTHRQSSLGAALLKSFTVTFDPRNSRVCFERPARTPVATPPMRSTGLSFRKTPAYWKVIGVIPHSPAEEASIAPGDLVARINGEPVAAWDVDRYDRLVAGSPSVEYTLLDGTREVPRRVRVVDLVP